MGGQACILYGAAEFSRDIDIAVLVSPDNLNDLQDVLVRLQTEPVYVPDMTEEMLLKGHACHFRCHAQNLEGLRIDVMGKLRGVDDFPVLWDRRMAFDLPAVGRVPVMALEDLVASKKTQRDKDWPMIRRLVEADYHKHRQQTTDEKIRFWLKECRTPEILQSLVRSHPELAQEIEDRRLLLNAVIAGSPSEIDRLLREEEDRERALDRQYWTPLKEELERFRHARKR